MRSIRSLVLIFLHVPFVTAEVVSGERNCTCGFYDTQTKELFTDSIIAYFNETTNLPNDFVAEDYVQKFDQDWAAVYRQGANPANVRYDESDGLQLIVQPATKERLVRGGGIRTIRRDIQHGSFRALFRPPRQASGGSALSMIWQYNETEFTELSVMNTNNDSEAWVGTFVNNEFTTRNLGVDFSELLEQDVANRNYTALGGGLSNGSIDAWDYTEYRIDWTKDYIDFYTGGDRTRQVSHKDNHALPSVPSAFFFKHWSTGNRWSMQGPPYNDSVASIRWIRMFFNSSSISKDAQEEFDASCPLTEACSMDDFTLRGSTPFTDTALEKWKQNDYKNFKGMPALWLSVGCIALSTLLLIHTFIRRMSQPKSSAHGHVPTSMITPESTTTPKKVPIMEKEDTEDPDEISTQSVSGRMRHSASQLGQADDLIIEQIGTSVNTCVLGTSTPQSGYSEELSTRCHMGGTTSRLTSLHNSIQDGAKGDPKSSDGNHVYLQPISGSSLIPRGSTNRIHMRTVTDTAFPAPRMNSRPRTAHQRIDYLAGLTTLCSMVVTFMHFGLTFIPGIVPADAPQLDRSEYWTQTIFAPILLNQMWLGVFLTTSVRFLVAPYLSKGRVEDIARAATRRTPRLMIPVAGIALLEYFLIDVGATKYLRYIPSLSWSTYPYVIQYPNFGRYVSEVLELVFLIPNAVPQISLHYCTGVLWAVTVQLQGTWLVLLGVMIVYEIKSPWKRMGFSTFCLVNHWYAQSWGSYLWFGLALTDLDVTLRWKSYLSARPAAYYALLTLCWLCIAAGFAVDLLPIWTHGDFLFATAEHDIHPDLWSGEALLNTGNKGYPASDTPRLNGLLAACGVQTVVELSSSVQWVLSTRPFTLLFPHIFTIFLLHGFVFWSWGSWLMVGLAERNFSYGVNVTIVGVTSYFILFAALPLVTPILEALGKDMTSFIWMTAQEKSPPRRRTLYPFPEDIFTGRAVNAKKDAQVNIEAGLGNRASDLDGNSVREKHHGPDSRVVVHALTTDEQHTDE